MGCPAPPVGEIERVRRCSLIRVVRAGGRSAGRRGQILHSRPQAGRPLPERCIYVFDWVGEEPGWRALRVSPSPGAAVSVSAADQLNDIHTVTLRTPGPGRSRLLPSAWLSAQRRAAGSPAQLGGRSGPVPAASGHSASHSSEASIFHRMKAPAMTQAGTGSAAVPCGPGTGRALSPAVPITAARGHFELAYVYVCQMRSVLHQVKLAT